MGYSKDELERSKKALEDAMEKQNYDVRVGEKRKREEDARNLAAQAKEDVEAQERVEQSRADERNQKIAKTETDQAAKLNRELIESGVKGYDTYATSMNMVFMSALQDGKALRATYRPYSKMWNLIKNTPWAVGKLGDLGGNALRPLKEGAEDALGVHKQAGDRHLHRGNFNPHEMLEIGAEGQLSFRGSFGNLPGFEDVKGKPDVERNMKEFFLHSTYCSLEKAGYTCEKNDTTGEMKWTRVPEGGGIAEPLTPGAYEALYDYIIPLTLEEAYDKKDDAGSTPAPGF